MRSEFESQDRANSTAERPSEGLQKAALSKEKLLNEALVYAVTGIALRMEATAEGLSSNEGGIRIKRRAARQSLRIALGMLTLSNIRYKSTYPEDETSLLQFLASSAVPDGPYLSIKMDSPNGSGKIVQLLSSADDVLCPYARRKAAMSESPLLELASFRVYEVLKKEGSQEYYVEGRSFLIDSDNEEFFCAKPNQTEDQKAFCARFGDVLSQAYSLYITPEGEKKYQMVSAVKRFFLTPGQLEQQVFAALDNLGIAYEKWPEFDTWDAGFTTADNTRILIDAKRHKAVGSVVAAAENVTEKDARCLFVVPDEWTASQLELANEGVSSPVVSIIPLRQLSKVLEGGLNG